MAEPEAGSNLVSGAGSNAATFTLPGSPRFRVESVVATIDNTAGADTTATLTMADTNGAVIARRRQGAAIDAGATTTATWALRLADETDRSGAAYPVGFYDLAPMGGNPVPSGTQAAYLRPTFAAGGAGVDILDTGVLNVPPSFSVKRDGVYCFMARVGMDPDPVVPWPPDNYIHLDLSPVAADPPPANSWATEATTTYPLDNTGGAAINTIYTVRFMPAFVPGGQTYYWNLYASWNYVGDVQLAGFLEAIRIG